MPPPASRPTRSPARRATVTHRAVLRRGRGHSSRPPIGRAGAVPGASGRRGGAPVSRSMSSVNTRSPKDCGEGREGAGAGARGLWPTDTLALHAGHWKALPAALSGRVRGREQRGQLAIIGLTPDTERRLASGAGLGLDAGQRADSLNVDVDCPRLDDVPQAKTGNRDRKGAV